MIILGSTLGGIILIFIIIVTSVIYNNKGKLVKFNNMNAELMKQKDLKKQNEIIDEE